jgi:N-acetylmuramoyl-L-alanine amidase
MNKRTATTKIIWHCTATPEGREVTLADLRKWHVEDNGWLDIGYHYLVQLPGHILPCRGEQYVGAHCKGENHDSIGIVYSGGLMNDGSMRAKDTRTPQQIEAMYNLTQGLLDKYNLTWDDVYGHNQFAAKACPSFDVPADIARRIKDGEPGDVEPNMPDFGAFGEYLVDLEDRVRALEAWARSGGELK